MPVNGPNSNSPSQNIYVNSKKLTDEAKNLIKNAKNEVSLLIKKNMEDMYDKMLTKALSELEPSKTAVRNEAEAEVRTMSPEKHQKLLEEMKKYEKELQEDMKSMKPKFGE